MSNIKWGEATWMFFHTLAEKIKDEHYDEEKENILTKIKTICSLLPCPDCRQHARIYMSKISIRHVSTKNSLKKMLFDFHNNVNKRTRKTVQKIEYLEIYENKNFKNVFIEFIREFSKPVMNMRFMNDNLKRNIEMKNIISYIENVYFKIDN